MKTFYSIILLFISCQILNADCGSAINVYPNKPYLNQNSKIILQIEGYFTNSTIEGFQDSNTKYPIFLTCSKHKIKLNLDEILIGVAMIQGIYSISSPLIKDNYYEIENPKNNFFSNLKRRNECGEKEKIYWIATGNTDNEPPQITKEPKFQKTEFFPMSCGSLMFSVFEIQAIDTNSEIFVETELKEIESGNISRYFLKLEKQNLRIGHGMCAGAFTYEREKKYMVRFKIYDICGNAIDKNWEWVNCPNPLDKFQGVWPYGSLK